MKLNRSKTIKEEFEADIQFPIYFSYDDSDDTWELDGVIKVEETGKVYEITVSTSYQGQIEYSVKSTYNKGLKDYLGHCLSTYRQTSAEEFSKACEMVIGVLVKSNGC